MGQCNSPMIMTASVLSTDHTLKTKLSWTTPSRELPPPPKKKAKTQMDPEKNVYQKFVILLVQVNYAQNFN